jgi:hypothetical protein
LWPIETDAEQPALQPVAIVTTTIAATAGTARRNFPRSDLVIISINRTFSDSPCQSR